MAKEDVNIKVSANVAEAIRMWQAMEEGPKGMADALEKMGHRGKRASSGITDEFKKLAGQWVSIAAGIKLAKETLDLFVQVQKESLALASEATVPVDALSRQFQNQGTLSNEDAAAARQQILDIAQQRGIDPKGAFDAGRQLVSSGFTPEEVVEGGALDEFLKLQNATNASRPDVDPERLAKAAVQFLQATKQGLTAEAIRDNAMTIQGLFTGTNLQGTDLEQFSKRAASVNDITGLQGNQLPILSQLLDVTDVNNAGTSLLAAVRGLGTAAAEPAKVSALKSAGLKPEDVDFVGEDFFTVQRRVADALERMPDNLRNIFFKRVFGAEGSLAGGILFSQEGVAETQRRLNVSASEESFERARAITEGSLEAKQRSAESRKAKAFYDPNFIESDTARQNLLSEIKNRGGTFLEVGLTGLAFDTAEFLGADAETAVRFATDSTIAPGVIEQSRSSQPENLTPQKVDVQVELVDQNAVAIPHKSTVNQLSR
ncbi:MAG: phage tail tape measure protein [Planctomycetes bacterium]|nr:phage tail tape measure protein [Planctomycetota bacterium]